MAHCSVWRATDRMLMVVCLLRASYLTDLRARDRFRSEIVNYRRSSRPISGLNLSQESGRSYCGLRTILGDRTTADSLIFVLQELLRLTLRPHLQIMFMNDGLTYP